MSCSQRTWKSWTNQRNSKEFHNEPDVARFIREREMPKEAKTESGEGSVDVKME